MFSFLGLMRCHAESHSPYPYVYCRTKEFLGAGNLDRKISPIHKTKKLIAMTALTAAFAGCTSVEITREGSYNDAQLKMRDCSDNPYHIDWDIAHERVNGSGVSTCWFWFFSSSDGHRYAAPGFTFDSGTATAKDAATYDAVEKAKCDALLGCMYRVTKTSKWFGIFKETKAEVKGFPANVKSIDLIKDRPVILEKDQQLIRLNNWETISSR